MRCCIKHLRCCPDAATEEGVVVVAPTKLVVPHLLLMLLVLPCVRGWGRGGGSTPLCTQLAAKVNIHWCLDPSLVWSCQTQSHP